MFRLTRRPELVSRTKHRVAHRLTYLVLVALALMGSAAAQARDYVALYRELVEAPLDPARVFHVREATLDREDLHVYLNEGTLAFTRDVAGHITGAFFDGDGQVLLRPPDLAERTSLGLFTGRGILDEHFTSAYLRFNDDTFAQLARSMLKIDDEGFTAEHQRASTALAAMDALRLLGTFSSTANEDDRFLHARFLGRLGAFDVIYDSLAEEQLIVGGIHSNTAGETYFDLWMAFNGSRVRHMSDRERAQRMIDPWRSSDAAAIDAVSVDAHLLPPEQIDATADLNITIKHGGQRLLVFELSRYLRVASATVDGAPVPVLQNEAVSGTELAKRGNDLVSLVMANPLRDGQKLKIQVRYAGPVMSKAAEGLLYIGERGTWYPNRGLAMSNFRLRFRWPQEWTLVATGRRVSLNEGADGELVGEWQSDGAVPVAGFNLGKYVKSSARAGNITVDSFATVHVEQALAHPRGQKQPGRAPDPGDILVVLPPDKLDPSQGSQTVAENAARAVQKFSEYYGPYPYSTLSLTQFPAALSQGWPTLVFLASSSFLSDDERVKLKMSPFLRVLYGEMMQAHETAHQWWGDLVGWKTYRDQWISEGLANYSALMLLEPTKPKDARIVLDAYRDDLLREGSEGRAVADAGPVTLGYRLNSSTFPTAYVAVTYGRGTWLIHMLRTAFRDASTGTAAQRDAAFISALRSLRDTYAHKSIGVDELQKAFEAKMPAALQHEGRRSLDWFFDGWVNGTAIPTLKLRNVKFVTKAGVRTATFTIDQTDCPDDLVTSVPIFAVDGAGQQTYAGRVYADGHDTSAKLKVPAATKSLVLDPNFDILRRP